MISGTTDDPRADLVIAPRVTGKYTGTTDQILQWAACKWGIDKDSVRAQAAVESWWRQTTKGDWTTNSANCAPGHGLGVDGVAGQCPEGWLNSVDRGSQYAAGDVWVCVGRWYAGRWHTQPAEDYITKVKDYLNQRIWESASFQEP